MPELIQSNHRVLCYGDSNTWGYIPNGGGQRLAFNKRWPNILSRLLGDKYEVVENGMNNRTTAIDDNEKPWLNGLSQLMGVLMAHKPLSWLIIFLGGNDLKVGLKQSVADVVGDLKRLVDAAKSAAVGFNKQPPEIMLVAPAAFDKTKFDGNPLFDEESVIKSAQLGEALKAETKDWGVHFVDTVGIPTSRVDGLHLEAGQHQQLAERLYHYIQQHASSTQ